MGATIRLHTDFAPPERAEPAEIAADVSLFDSFELVQELFAAVPDPYVVLNEERQIIFANQAFLDVIGADNVQQIAGSRPGEAVHCIHAAENEAGCGTTEFCQECGAVRAILQSQRGRESIAGMPHPLLGWLGP